MKLGYACQNITLKTIMRTCRLKTVELEGISKIKELTLHNLREVRKMINWNINNGIYFFRVSSDIVPFGSHEVLTWDWWRDEDVLDLTEEIKSISERNQVRLSVHPGQYTIINSPNEKVIKNAFRDLDYHNKLMNLVGGKDMVIHIGGAYGDKEVAKQSFINNYHKLDKDIQNKLLIENDDKVFHVKDALDVSKKTSVPVCFDIHHHRCNPYDEEPLQDLLNQVYATWTRIPKMHISSGKEHKQDPRHHDYILMEDYQQFIDLLGNRDVDLMFEAKKKELSVLTILNKIT
ncbi:MAG: UV DNA damage repair endonuclease UvsE [Bacillaceae bacterium]|nr:UV DNA damage repair endonuclease UvsE [Bacillaceae bacterium]